MSALQKKMSNLRSKLERGSSSLDYPCPGGTSDSSDEEDGGGSTGCSHMDGNHSIIDLADGTCLDESTGGIHSPPKSDSCFFLSFSFLLVVFSFILCFTPFHFISPHPLHFIPSPQFTPLHLTPFHSTPPHFTSFHFTPLFYFTPFHSSSLLHSIPLQTNQDFKPIVATRILWEYGHYEWQCGMKVECKFNYNMEKSYSGVIQHIYTYKGDMIKIHCDPAFGNRACCVPCMV